MHLESAARLYHEAIDRKAAAWVHARLARARSSFIQTMDMPRALLHYGQAEGALGDGPPTARLGYLYAGYASAANTLLRPDETAQLARRGMDIAASIGDPGLWHSAAVNEAHTLVLAGRLREGLDRLAQVWVASDREGFLIPAFMAVWYLAFWHTELGDPKEARRWIDRELARPRYAAESHNRTLLLHFLSEAHAMVGDIDAARRTLEGLPAVPPLGIQRAVVAFIAGNWDEAPLLLAEVLSTARRSRNGVSQTLALVRLASVLIAEDDLVGATAACDEALALLPRPHCNVPLIYTRMPLLRALVLEGNVDRADAELVKVRRLMTPGEDWRGLAGRVALATAEVAAARGRQDEADTAFASAAATFRRYGLVGDEVALLLDRGHLSEAADQPERAQEYRGRASEMLASTGAGGRWTAVVASRPTTM